MLRRIQRAWATPILLVGRKNRTVTLEQRVAVSYATNHAVAILPAIVFLGIYPRGIQICAHIKPVHECLQQLYSL